MTFLRSSDVKNHLYTGSGPKHHLVSDETSLASENEAAPAVAALDVFVPVDAHPAIESALRPVTASGTPTRR